ncbi:hypothetical protein AgCh_032169 [Apium graveolens]
MLKIARLNAASKSVMVSDKYKYVRELAQLLTTDPRLGDQLKSEVVTRLIQFLENKRFNITFYAAIVLSYIVSSKHGSAIKDETVPYLLNLIPSPDMMVRVQALITLNEIAKVYPDSCDTMIKNGVLELLESLFTNKDKIDASKKNIGSLLERAGGLLTTLCRMKQQLQSDVMIKVVRIISIAIVNDFELVLIQICLLISILSDRGFVEIGFEVIRLLDLIDHSQYKIVISALRTIGNYVRWGSVENIQEVIGLGLIDMLIKLVRTEEFEVKEVAARAIFNAVSVRSFCHDDGRVVTLCSKILQLDNIGASMTTGTTAADRVSASAKCARPFEKVTRKKNRRRCKKLFTVASSADPLTDLKGDLGSEGSLDSAMEELGSKVNARENKLKEDKNTAASLLGNSIKPPQDLDCEEIVSREKPLSVDSTEELDSKKLKENQKLSSSLKQDFSIDSLEDLGSEKLKEVKKLLTAASPESSSDSKNDLGCEKIVRKCNLNRATDNYPSCAQENKLKPSKKLSATASTEDLDFNKNARTSGNTIPYFHIHILKFSMLKCNIVLKDKVRFVRLTSARKNMFVSLETTKSSGMRVDKAGISQRFEGPLDLGSRRRLPWVDCLQVSRGGPPSGRPNRLLMRRICLICWLLIAVAVTCPRTLPWQVVECACAFWDPAQGDSGSGLDPGSGSGLDPGRQVIQIIGSGSGLDPGRQVIQIIGWTLVGGWSRIRIWAGSRLTSAGKNMFVSLETTKSSGMRVDKAGISQRFEGKLHLARLRDVKPVKLIVSGNSIASRHRVCKDGEHIK